MAGSFAEDGVHLFPVRFRETGGNEGLDGSGESAPVDPADAARAAEEVLGQAEREGEPLLFDVDRGIDVLEEFEAGVSGRRDAGLEAFDIPGTERPKR